MHASIRCPLMVTGALRFPEQRCFDSLFLVILLQKREHSSHGWGRRGVGLTNECILQWPWMPFPRTPPRHAWIRSYLAAHHRYHFSVKGFVALQQGQKGRTRLPTAARTNVLRDAMQDAQPTSGMTQTSGYINSAGPILA